MNKTIGFSRRRMLQGSSAALAALGLSGTAGFAKPSEAHANELENAMSTDKRRKPTIVLVHGAFADASSWDDVTNTLQGQGYLVVAIANPLRGVKNDADYAAAMIKVIKGPIVLVGHSYGGLVIGNAATGNPQVKALVFVAAFAAEAGENAFDLSTRFPGSTLGDTLAPVPLAEGINDLTIHQDKFRSQFCADVPEAQARCMAAAQRPCTDVALNEKAGAPAWKMIPSWFVFGDQDKNIPVALQRFMAERAKARETVEIKGASHALTVSYPDTVASVILRAAEKVS